LLQPFKPPKGVRHLLVEDRVMASIITHSLVGLAAGAVVPGLQKSKRFWALCALCPSIPDADTIGFRFGVHYGDMLGHRGFSHSILFALLLGALVATTEFRRVSPPIRWGSRAWLGIAAFFALISATHGCLDAMTDGGLGVGFFVPFSPERYFFPWTPIRVSPIGVASFVSKHGLAVIQSEFLYVWLPVGAILLASLGLRRLCHSQGKKRGLAPGGTRLD
jgi:inner membrane protein